jgi:hypothetical protein
MHKGMWRNSRGQLTADSFGKVYQPDPGLDVGVFPLDGMVVRTEPEAPAPEPEQQANPVIEFLVKIIGDAVTKDESLRVEKSELLTEALDFGARLGDLLARIEAHRVAGLTVQNLELKEACRAQWDVCQKIQEQIAFLLGGFNRTQEKTAEQRSALKVALANIPSDNLWPTAAAVAKAEARVEACREALRLTEAEMNGILNEHNNAQLKLSEEQQKLRALGEREKETRFAIEGKPLEDPELGLTAIPSV